MSSKSPALELFSHARQALADAQTIDQFKKARDLAVAATRCAGDMQAAGQLLFDAACRAIRAEHALGTALSQMRPAMRISFDEHSTMRKMSTMTARPTSLREFGIAKAAAYRARLLATLSQKQLDRWLAGRCTEARMPTLTAAGRYASEVAASNARTRIGRVKIRKAVTAPRPQDDALTDLQQHLSMLDQLLSRVYDGGSLNFGCAEGRFIRRLVHEAHALVRSLAKNT